MRLSEPVVLIVSMFTEKCDKGKEYGSFVFKFRIAEELVFREMGSEKMYRVVLSAVTIRTLRNADGRVAQMFRHVLIGLNCSMMYSMAGSY